MEEVYPIYLQVEEVEVHSQLCPHILKLGDGMVLQLEEAQLQAVLALVMVLQLVQVLWELLQRLEQG